VLKSGGAYLPLDPEYPAERLRFMLEHARARVLVAGGQLPEGLAQTPATVLRLDVEADAAQDYEDIPSGETTREDLVYVLYTSGSTGQPKGVAMRHGALLNLLEWQIGRSAPAPRTLQFASLNFDVSFQEIFSTLCAGGTLVLIEEATRRDPEALLEALARGRVERLYLPFVALQSLAEAADRSATLPETLREVVTAGEQLKITPQVSRMFERLGYCVLENQYGPTEAHVVSAYRMAGGTAGWPELPPIGRPIANTRLYVLDARLQPVPPGVVGELYIGGECLARGYLGRAEDTSEKFVPDPFGAEPGLRLYRTGDLARFLAEGDIQFLGRRDRQVKVRGYRVEIGEIETALAGHAGVGEAVVEALAGATGAGRLAAYVVAAEGARPSPAQMRAYLKERLPEYMIPSAFVFLEEFPLTPSGKVDRRALPEPSGALAGAADAYLPPRTATEEVLEAIWADVLGLEKVSAGANFFELGGHSLMATQVVSRVREAFQVELPLRRLFEEPTVAGLARAVEAARLAGRAHELPPLNREPHAGALPLSFAQQRLWFWEQLQPGTPTYVLTTALRLRGALDAKALGQTLNEVARRHDTLRASFTEADGEPVQLIAPTAEIVLDFVDLTRLPQAEREGEAKRFAEKDALRPFDLARGPLLRAALLRLDAQEHVAVLSMHHIISDGWSMGVLVNEVAALYEAFVEGNPSPLAELPVQYPDFVRWQRRLLQGDELERQLGYWKRQLDGAPTVLELPTDYPRPDVYTSQGASLEVRLPPELSEELKRLSHRAGVTLYMTLLAAFDVLLHRYTSQDEIVVGADMANRTQIETEGLIGFFVNMLVLRTDLSGDPSFRELLGRVRETALGAYVHQDVPFALLVDALNVERELSRNPLFQVVFVLQNAPLRPLALRGLSLEPFGFETKTSTFDLVLSLSETEEGIGGALTYSTALFRRETVERMMNHYRMILEGVVADPDGRLSDVSIMRDAEVAPLTADDFQKVKLSRKDLENLILEVSQASQTE
jgi:amino acid adenylation domain-containing protein